AFRADWPGREWRAPHTRRRRGGRRGVAAAGGAPGPRRWYGRASFPIQGADRDAQVQPPIRQLWREIMASPEGHDRAGVLVGGQEAHDRPAPVLNRLVVRRELAIAERIGFLE